MSGIYKGGVTIEFDTELMDGEITLHCAVAGVFETCPDGEIIAVGISKWDAKARRFAPDYKWFRAGSFFDILRATLKRNYGDDIIDALYDRDVSIAEAAADLRNRSLVDA